MQFTITLTDAAADNMCALLRKRRALEKVVEAATYIHRRHDVKDSEIHLAIDSTRRVIDSDIVKLLSHQLYERFEDSAV